MGYGVVQQLIIIINHRSPTSHKTRDHVYIPAFWRAWQQTWSWRVATSWNCWVERQQLDEDTVAESECALQSSPECLAS